MRRAVDTSSSTGLRGGYRVRTLSQHALATLMASHRPARGARGFQGSGRRTARRREANLRRRRKKLDRDRNPDSPFSFCCLLFCLLCVVCCLLLTRILHFPSLLFFRSFSFLPLLLLFPSSLLLLLFLPFFLFSLILPSSSLRLLFLRFPFLFSAPSLLFCPSLASYPLLSLSLLPLSPLFSPLHFSR